MKKVCTVFRTRRKKIDQIYHQNVIKTRAWVCVSHVVIIQPTSACILAMSIILLGSLRVRRRSWLLGLWWVVGRSSRHVHLMRVHWVIVGVARRRSLCSLGRYTHKHTQSRQLQDAHRLIDWVKVLRATDTQIGYFTQHQIHSHATRHTKQLVLPTAIYKFSTLHYPFMWIKSSW